MDEKQKYTCPNCGGLVDYGSKFCPHCRYEFGAWGEETAANDTAAEAAGGGNNSSRLLMIAAALAVIIGAVYWFMQPNTEKLVATAIESGEMMPVFEMYRQAADEDKPQIAYEIAEAAFKITLDEVDVNDNREFLKTLYNAVNNPKNNNLHIQAGGKDEYMSPFIALVKYAFVQSQLEEMKTETENALADYLPAGKNIDATQIDPHTIQNIDAWVSEPLGGGYVIYGTRYFFYQRFPDYHNCLGVLYLPEGGSGSSLQGDAYNMDVVRIGSTTLSWDDGRLQDVPELLAVDGYFKDMLWKNISLNDVYKPLDIVKKDLHTMFDNLQLVKKHYKTATPNLNFDGLNFNSTEDEFYNKAPLRRQKGEGTIHVTNIFANGVAVDFMPYFNYLVQDSVTLTGSFAGALSNGIKIGDDMQAVVNKMQPYYQLKNSGGWITYLMPNGQLFNFRFYNNWLDQITIREAPDWKNY